MLLLEHKQETGPAKVEESTQIENRGPDLGPTAGDAQYTSLHPMDSCLVFVLVNNIEQYIFYFQFYFCGLMPVL